jgi:hypothetical protein
VKSLATRNGTCERYTAADLKACDQKQLVAFLMTPDTFVPLFVIGAGFVLLVFYFPLVQLRRRKFRQLAAEMGAEYLSQGLFKTGKIAGTSNGRKYQVEIKGQGRQNSLWTVFEMECANKGIPLRIYGRFFKDFPNWPGGETERLIGANVIVQNLELH